MRTLGVDPGLSGALALLDGAGELAVLEDLPVIADGKLHWIDASRLLPRILELKSGRPMRAIVERQQAMPAQGRSSCLTIGVALGSLLATLQAAGCSIELISASAWKAALGLGSDKQASLDRARLLFPSAELHLVKHHNRAEAALIAHWALTRDRRAAA